MTSKKNSRRAQNCAVAQTCFFAPLKSRGSKDRLARGSASYRLALMESKAAAPHPARVQSESGQL